jgi:pimeloyl-ACP methyl ester carboxylesterase
VKIRSLFRCGCLSLGILGGAFAPATVIAEPEPKDSAGSERAADRFVALFRPTQTDLASLSPDGRLLAYTYREQDVLSVVIVEVDHPDKVKAKVAVVDDARATPLFNPLRERTPASIRWMRWVGDDRLVVETNAQAAVTSTRSLPGTILAFDADGGNARLLLNARSLEEQVPAFTLERGVRDRQPLGQTVDNPNFGIDASRGSGTATPLQPGQPYEEPAGVLFTPLGASADPDAPVTAAIDSRFEIISRPLVPSVFDLDPRTPGSILVRALGSASLLVYSVDTRTGRLQLRSEHLHDPELIPLLDRQGVPRISVPATTQQAFPHTYLLERGPGARAGFSLDAVAGYAPARPFALSPETFFRERALPLGFDEKPEILYYASNVGRDTFGIYSLDLATGTKTAVAIEHPRIDLIPLPDGGFVPSGALVFDRFTRNLVGVRIRDPLRSALWLNSQLKAVQDTLAATLVGRNIDVLEWDVSGRRFLAAVSGPSDAGGFVVFDSTTRKALQFARRAPWLDTQVQNQTVSVTLGGKTAPAIACQLTLSRHAKVKPMPLIVVCPSVPWERIPADFQPEVQALADMGFAVLQIDGRGAWGTGLAPARARPRGVCRGPGRRPHRGDRRTRPSVHARSRRVGIIGVGYGGHVALRTAMLNPGRFRCVVTLDAPIDLERWLSDDRWTTRAAAPQFLRGAFGSPAELKSSSLLPKAGNAQGRPRSCSTSPARTANGAARAILESKQLASALRQAQTEVELVELTEDFVRGLPQARAAIYRSIELFFNTHVYDFSVKIGDVKVQEDPALPPSSPP